MCVHACDCVSVCVYVCICTCLCLESEDSCVCLKRALRRRQGGAITWGSAPTCRAPRKTARYKTRTNANISSAVQCSAVHPCIHRPQSITPSGHPQGAFPNGRPPTAEATPSRPPPAGHPQQATPSRPPPTHVEALPVIAAAAVVLIHAVHTHVPRRVAPDVPGGRVWGKAARTGDVGGWEQTRKRGSQAGR